MKIAEGRYTYGRCLYLPKTVAKALGITFRDTVEYHTDGKQIYLVKGSES